MTGYTVHTGANEKFVAGWDQAFGGKKAAAPKSPAKKKTAAKSAAKKRPPRKTTRGK